MRLPASSAGYRRRVRYGRYVTTRLRHARREEAAAAVEAATREVRDTARAVEDASEPVEEALALRDACDSDMDDAAQECRLKLASRSLDAMTKAPYTAIFPKGIDYYIAAPVLESGKRMLELATRVETNLPADDEQREVADVLRGGADAYQPALNRVAEARTGLALARTARDAATEDWEALMERTFGLLVADLGRRRANRFFPRYSRASDHASEEPETAEQA